MERHISSLNIPICALNKLQSVGKSYCCDLTETDLNSFCINLKKCPRKSALELLQEELLNGSILSYIVELDKVLKDEIAWGRITEFAGYPGTGKTQICLRLCVTTQLPRTFGGLEGQVIYVNTNKNFSVNRLREISDSFLKQVGNCSNESLSTENILENVHVFCLFSIEEIFALTNILEEFLQNKKVKLLIIDSISHPLRDVDLKDKSTLTYELMEKLQKLAIAFKFAVVLTNDYTTRVKNNQPYYAPSLGDGFFDRVNSRICLSKSNECYVAEIVKSPLKTRAKVNFSIT